MSIHRWGMCILIGSAVLAGGAAAQSRGERLYATRCAACHTTQVHWRDRRLATDWNSLRAQVMRWQAMGRLDWSEKDIDAVTRYLNESFYGFRSPSGPRVATHAAVAHSRVAAACPLGQAAAKHVHTTGLRVLDSPRSAQE